jgi:membrane protease YdiL (CAAX protease family)
MNKATPLRLACYIFFVFITLGFGFFAPVFIAAFAGLCVIIFLTWYLLREDPVSYLLIPNNRKHLKDFFTSFLAGIFFCTLLCALLKMSNIGYDFRIVDTIWIICLTVPLQSLYEEVIFRSLLQRRLLSRFFQGNDFRAVLLALVFSVSHWINYKVTAGVELQLSTLAALFAFGLAGGLLFNIQNNLSGAWGFHAGWNTVRFGLAHSVAGVSLTEAATFDHIEGSMAGVVVAVVVLAAVLVWAHFVRHQIPAAKADR